jgi:hypothetical protein
MTSPDIGQSTSVKEASWNTSAFVAPATPANVAESTKGDELVALASVAERNCARFILPYRLEHFPEGTLKQQRPQIAQRREQATMSMPVRVRLLDKSWT